MWLAVLGFVVAGCGRIAFDPLDDAMRGDGGDGDGATAGDATMGDAAIDVPAVCDPASCADAPMNVPGGGQIAFGVAISNHGYMGSCVGGTTSESVWRVNASASGVHLFEEVSGSNGRGLYIRTGCCDGPEVACVPMGGTHMRAMQAGTPVFVVIEATNGLARLRVTGP